MNTRSSVTKTISLTLNFNNENRYHFTVKIPRKTSTDELWGLTGVNSAGTQFALGGLTKALMRLLVQLNHATKRAQGDWYEPGYWPCTAKEKTDGGGAC
jgi:hypothetical protein